MGIEVRRFTWDYLDSNMYVLIEADQALVIDPIDSDDAFEYLRPFREIIVLLTHEHFDHVCGLNKLRSEHQCTVIAQEKCSERVQNSKTNFSAMADIMLELSGMERDKRVEPFVCEKADIIFEEKHVLKWQGADIEIISTPGHSPGSVCISIGKYFFTGDSFLEKGPMNRFPGGSKNEYYQKTIPIIKRQTKNVSEIFPGHGDKFAPNVINWI